MESNRQPAIFLPHGGGPWPWVPSMRTMHGAMASYFSGLISGLPTRPTAVLMVSAHWEENAPTVQVSPAPPMLYDYSGFPKETYAVQWPAPGAPDLAGEVESLLAAGGFNARRDGKRGFDHGAFVPMALANPKADMPTLQLSLLGSLDPAQHLAMGRALLPLREQGVLIIGSGMGYHNLPELMRAMRSGKTIEASKFFDEWLVETLSADPSSRESGLADWARAPMARASHPREEHLLPLHVCAGAAGEDPVSFPYREVVVGAHLSAAQFG